MIVEHIILTLVVVLGLSLLAQPVSRLTHLPFPSILVLLGFIASEVAVYSGIDTGIRADNFQSIIFYVFIPVLVFECAYNIDKQQLKKNIVVILSLAIITMLLTCVIAAALLFYGIGHESGFPWIAALITGAVLAATDPVSVIEKLRKLNVPERICLLLEGESLFNDAAAIVLFSLFLSMATASAGVELSGDMYAITTVIKDFVIIFTGGALTGAVVGLAFGFMQNKMKQDLLCGVMSVMAAYGSYLLAEYFEVSGVMSTLLAALIFSMMRQDAIKSSTELAISESAIKYLWDVLSHVARVSVFLVVGAVITFEMFEQRWLAMLIAILSLLLARAISVYGVLVFFAFFKKMRVPFSSQTIMVWGGLRGAVTLALALSLPTSLEYWWTVQSIAFGVVVFSLFVQAPTMQLFIKRLSL